MAGVKTPWLGVISVWLLSGLVAARAELWQLKPGVTERGQVPSSWELDLRQFDPESAAGAAMQLSARLYGKTTNPLLNQPLVFHTDFPANKVFAFEITAVSAGGSDLLVKTNGVIVGRQAWPPGDKTDRRRHLFYVPLLRGSNSVSLEISQPGGVVVMERYFVADSVAQLPAVPIPLLFGSAAALAALPLRAAVPARVTATGGRLPVDDGYRGIWYYNQPTKDEYKFKYSGGFATYPYQHTPIAIYRKEVNKTFFVYGGTTARSGQEPQELLHLVSYYDHETGLVPRPRILLNKQTSDAHDNPTLQMDDQGYLWIFSPSHGTGRPSYIHRSTEPYSIAEFQLIQQTNFSYPQPWYVPGKGFLFLHTRYGGGKAKGINAARCLFWMTSADGVQWTEPQMLAGIEQGDYQVSWRRGQRVATAFDFHPPPLGLNARANVYYVETDDFGRTWRTIHGDVVKLPLTERNNPALVCDTHSEGQLVYLKDLNFDAAGYPVLLFSTSKGFEPGPANGPRLWQTVRWTGTAWVRSPLTTSDNNYDHGSLYIEADGLWRVIAPTEVGPQAFNPGGEVVMWRSDDQGQTWQRSKQLTHNSRLNHTFVRRPVDAHPQFYAFWADGDGRKPSESRLYFTNQRGDQVWRLPQVMTNEFAKPIVAW